MKRRWMLAAAAVSLALLGSLGCNPMGAEEEIAPQTVEVMRGDVVKSVNGSGNVYISDERDLYFGVVGRVDNTFGVEEGDAVSQGMLLASLETDALELALAQAGAALIQAQAAVDSAQADYLTAQATLEQANNDYKDMKRQDIHGYRRDIAEYALEAAEFALSAATIQLDAVDAQLGAAEKAVAEAQRELDEASITAPFDGVISEVNIKKGDFVNTSTAAIHVVDITGMEMLLSLDEIDIPQVKVGQSVLIEVDALPELSLEGKVKSINPMAKIEVGVVLYDVKIAFEVEPGIGLFPGMSAEADIIIDERSDVLIIPERVIGQDDDGNPVVTVLADDEAAVRLVETGLSDGFYIEVVAGLEEGELVLIAKPQSEDKEVSRSGFPFH